MDDAPFLGTESGETRGGALTNKHEMEIALINYADPGFRNGVSEVAGVSHYLRLHCHDQPSMLRKV